MNLNQPTLIQFENERNQNNFIPPAGSNSFYTIGNGRINLKSIRDDKDDYKITHIVYHEVDALRGIDQYWIKYTITDASGKYSSKTQKIEFENKPSEDEVTSFAYYVPD